MSWPSPVDPVTVTINGVTHVGTYYVQRSRVHTIGLRIEISAGWRGAA